MILRNSILLLVLSALIAPSVCRADEPIEKWWLSQHRLLQTNLREIDADMDLDQYLADVQALGADVVLFNVGGIVANYPTQLEYHWKNTYMNGDLVGTVLDRLHAHDIRMIGRFDFSKINEKFAAQHPDWLYVSEKGEQVNYNGQVHTCVSGGYQQEYMFEILGEAIDRYPLDGVFFNMIGYRRRDYSGNDHGICQCDNCKRLFRDYSGMDLPATQEDSQCYRKYTEFTRMMTDRQFHRVNAFLKKKQPDLAICTYTSSGVDVIRKESNRPLGQGTYHDTDKAKFTLLTCGERQLANAAVHFIDIPYRHAAVAPHLTARRLWQHMVNGAWLDFYCIGPLQRQEDRTNFPVLHELFQFHKRHQKWFDNTVPAGQIGLVRQGGEEYEGLVSILSENQMAYELVQPSLPQLGRYEIVIVPSAEQLGPDEVAALDQYVNEGGRLLVTGQVPVSLHALKSMVFQETIQVDKGGYIRIRPEDREQMNRPVLDQLDLVFLRGPFHVYQHGNSDTSLLRLIPPDMFGPPEKCYYRHVSDHPAFVVCRHEKGMASCFPFDLGTLYHQQAHQGHAALLCGAIDHMLESGRRVQVETSPLVEINHRASRNGDFEWVSLYNHSGARGSALHSPLPIHDIALRLKKSQPVKRVLSLRTGSELPVTNEDDGWVKVVVDTLPLCDVIVFE